MGLCTQMTDAGVVQLFLLAGSHDFTTPNTHSFRFCLLGTTSMPALPGACTLHRCSDRALPLSEAPHRPQLSCCCIVIHRCLPPPTRTTSPTIGRDSPDAPPCLPPPPSLTVLYSQHQIPDLRQLSSLSRLTSFHFNAPTASLCRLQLNFLEPILKLPFLEHLSAAATLATQESVLDSLATAAALTSLTLDLTVPQVGVRVLACCRVLIVLACCRKVRVLACCR